MTCIFSIMGKSWKTISFILVHVLAFGQSSHNVRLAGQWSGSGLSVTNDDAIYNDVWGFSLSNRRYAAIGSTEGIHILEIDSDVMVVERDFVPGASQGPNVINRDVIEYSGYLYAICDNGYSSLQIIDLHYLPDSVHVVYDSDVFFQRAHSVFIDSSMARLYVCGPKSNINGDRALDVFSLTDPVNPVYLGSFNGAQYVHDCYVRNDTAWLNCGYEGLIVADFSNPSLPLVFNDYTGYAESGYNHSGWLSENGKYYVFTDETAGKRIKYCDVSDLTDIQLLSLFNSGWGAQTIAHNPMLFDDYVFVSHYKDGLQIFDIKNPASPVKAGWYDFSVGYSSSFSGAWGIFRFQEDGLILVSDMQDGLQVFEFSPPPRIEDPDFSFGIMPNPSFGETWFQVNNNRPISYSIRFYDSTGKLILSDAINESNNYRFDVSSWPGGIYFYQVEADDLDLEMSGKFVVTSQ